MYCYATLCALHISQILRKRGQDNLRLPCLNKEIENVLLRPNLTLSRQAWCYFCSYTVRGRTLEPFESFVQYSRLLGSKATVIFILVSCGILWSINIRFTYDLQFVNHRTATTNNSFAATESQYN